MRLTMDQAGRIVVPKALREAIGLDEGGPLDVSVYGAALHLTPGGRTARLVQTGQGLVAQSDTVVTDEMVFGLIDAGRR